MTPDMLVFVEEELLSGDFKIIENTVRIPIQNVFAEIINGKYDITLTDVEFRSRGKDTTYSLSCSMKYVRTVETRAFTDLQCRVYEDDKNRGFRFEGTSFPIIPGSIPLTEFSGKMEELGKYIEQIRLNTGTNYDAVFIDFTSKSVTIRGNTFPIP